MLERQVELVTSWGYFYLMAFVTPDKKFTS